jgi:hypothetical protein
VIDRSQDARQAVGPTGSRGRLHVWPSRRENHLGSGHVRPRQQTGHMIATDPTHASVKALQARGRPHMGPGLVPLARFAHKRRRDDVRGGHYICLDTGRSDCGDSDRTESALARREILKTARVECCSHISGWWPTRARFGMCDRVYSKSVVGLTCLSEVLRCTFHPRM